MDFCSSISFLSLLQTSVFQEFEYDVFSVYSHGGIGDREQECSLLPQQHSLRQFQCCPCQGCGCHSDPGLTCGILALPLHLVGLVQGTFFCSSLNGRRPLLVCNKAIGLNLCAEGDRICCPHSLRLLFSRGEGLSSQRFVRLRLFLSRIMLPKQVFSALLPSLCSAADELVLASCLL